jgi:hypothetical protein
LIQIGVIGSGTEISEDIKKISYEVGAEIAKRKAILICGGKGGVMEAACKGCKENNGWSIGILPSIHREEANPYVCVQIPTNLGEDRNYLVIQSSDAIICIAGAVGTNMEANYALKMNKILVTIPKSGGVSEKFGKKYVNDKKHRVFSVKDGKKAVSIAFSQLIDG